MDEDETQRIREARLRVLAPVREAAASNDSLMVVPATSGATQLGSFGPEHFQFFMSMYEAYTNGRLIIKPEEANASVNRQNKSDTGPLPKASKSPRAYPTPSTIQEVKTPTSSPRREKSPEIDCSLLDKPGSSKSASWRKKSEATCSQRERSPDLSQSPTRSTHRSRSQNLKRPYSSPGRDKSPEIDWSFLDNPGSSKSASWTKKPEATCTQRERSPDLSQSPTRYTHRSGSQNLKHPYSSPRREKSPEIDWSYLDKPGSSTSVSWRKKPEATCTQRERSPGLSQSPTRYTHRSGSQNLKHPYSSPRRYKSPEIDWSFLDQPGSSTSASWRKKPEATCNQRERSPDFSQSPTRISHRSRSQYLKRPYSSPGREKSPEIDWSFLDKPGSSKSAFWKKKPEATCTQRQRSPDLSQSPTRNSHRSRTQDLKRPYSSPRRAKSPEVVWSYLDKQSHSRNSLNSSSADLNRPSNTRRRESPDNNWSFLDQPGTSGGARNNSESPRNAMDQSPDQSLLKPLLPNLSKTLTTRTRSRRQAAPSYLGSSSEEDSQKTSRKKKAGRPPGSKNKPKCFSCKICEVVDEEPLVIIPDCGDIFHKTCITQALESQDEVCSYLKTCPRRSCAETFTEFLPFFG